MAKNDVTTTKDNLPAGLDFMADVGGGMEGTDKDSFAVPFLRVIQSMSPQLDEADAEYIEGAKEGMLINTVTNELFDGKEGITFVPCAFQRRFLRWAPRGQEPGFKGEYLPEEVDKMREQGLIQELDGRLYHVDDNGEVNTKKCDLIADTRSHFGLLLVNGQAQQVLLALGSTQIKKSKQLMSMLSNVKVNGPNGMVTPPTWLNQFKLTTARESNDQGKWMGVKFEPQGFIATKDVYDLGKEFHDAIVAGEAKANYADAEAAKTGSGDDGEGKF